jgi:hypothetical protein
MRFSERIPIVIGGTRAIERATGLWRSRNGTAVDAEEDSCSPTSGTLDRSCGSNRRGPGAPASLLRASRPRRRPGPPGLPARVRARGALTAGRIVETEAYLGPEDGASHAAFGLAVAGSSTDREASRTSSEAYGLHDCLNAIAGRRGDAGLRPHPRARARRRRAARWPAGAGNAIRPRIRAGARGPRERPGPVDPGARDHATRQRPGPPAAATQIHAPRAPRASRS